MKKYYGRIYGGLMIAILLTFLFWKRISDFSMLMLAVMAFILTSIFTYSRREK